MSDLLCLFTCGQGAIRAIADTGKACVAILIEADVELVRAADKPLHPYARSGEVEFVARPERTTQHAGDAACALSRIDLDKSFAFYDFDCHDICL